MARVIASAMPSQRTRITRRSFRYRLGCDLKLGGSETFAAYVTGQAIGSRDDWTAAAPVVILDAHARELPTPLLCRTA